MADGPAPPQGKKKRRHRALAAVVAVLGVGLVLLGLWAARVWTRPAPPGAAAVELTVPPGATLRQVAGALEAAGLVADHRVFELGARLAGGDRPVQVGTYRILRGLGWGRILAMLRRGDVIVIPITIPEGMPAIMVAERLAAQPRLSGPVPAIAEGSVLPATYAARPGDMRAAVVARMQAAMQRTLAELWPRRTAAAAVRTPEEAVILASIVEKETALPAERRRIAGLYSNRLRAGMRLEADPTVIYPVTRGKPLGRRIRRSELAADNGYNSYVRAGLPVGPITNPGRDSIAAVLDPEPGDFLFMVADGAGGHRFASSFAEHQENVRRWFAIRRSRGEL